MVKSVFLLMFLLFASLLSGADVPSFGDMKLKCNYDHAPEFRTRTGVFTSGGGFLDNEQYLVLEISYAPGVIDGNRKVKNSSSSLRDAWLDNVKMSVLIAYPEETGKNRKENVYGLFSGSTTFRTIPLNAKRRVAMMCVPPHLIARYTNIRRRSPAKKRTNAAASAAKVKTERPALRDYYVEVVFTDSDGKEIGRVYSNIDGLRTNREKSAYFRNLEKRVGSRIVKNAIYPRSESPWAFIDTERYDLIAPAEQSSTD